MGKLSPTRQAALGGVLAALAVTVMALGGFIPVATYCTPVLAALLLLPVVELCRKPLAWAWYVAVAVLSALLCPDVEAAVLFACLGYYPILQRDLHRVRRRPLRIMLKLLVFNVAVVVMYVILIFLLGLENVAREFTQEAPWVLILAWLLGNVTFGLTDLVLLRFAALLKNRLKKRS